MQLLIFLVICLFSVSQVTANQCSAVFIVSVTSNESVAKVASSIYCRFTREGINDE